MRRSKFGIRTDAAGKLARTCDGILFHSGDECRRYGELKMLEKAGKVWDLELQPIFVLHAPRRGVNGLRMPDERLGEYRGDFRYTTAAGSVTEDVKGLDTPLSKWKRKHVQAQYGIEVQIVRYR